MAFATVATTSKGMIRSVSPSFLTFLGRTADDLAAMAIMDVAHPDDVAELRRLLGDAGAPDFEPTATVRLFDAAGQWVSCPTSVRTGDDGRRLFQVDLTQSQPRHQAHSPAPATTTAAVAAAPNAVPTQTASADNSVATPAHDPAPAQASSAAPAPAVGASVTPAADAATGSTAPSHDPTGPAGWFAARGWSRSKVLGIVAVVALAFVFRTWDLSTLPTGLHGDEGVTGQEAERILRDGSIGVYTGSALGQPTGPFYLDAITVALFGNTIWALRILSALAGTLTVLAVYLIVERRVDHRTALAAAIALATMTWSIHFSRIAFGVAWWPLVVLLAVAAIDRAATEQTRRSWFIAGGLSALGVYVYNSHWSFGPAVVAFVGIWLLTRLLQRRKIGWVELVFGGIGALVVGLPMLQFIVQQDGFTNHFDVLNRRNTPEWIEASFGEKITTYAGWYFEVWKQILTQPVFDGTDASGVNRVLPLAFTLTAGVGAFEILRRHRTTFTGILVATLLVLPLTTVLTANAIVRRTYALSPLLAILIGFGAVALVDLASGSEAIGSGKKNRGTLAAAVLLVVALFTGVVPYFTAFRNNPGQRGVFTQELVIAAQAIDAAEQEGPVYVNFFSPRHDFLYPTVDFLVDDTPGESRAPVGQPFQPGLDLTLADIDDIDDVADQTPGQIPDQIFVLIGPYVDELARLQSINPGGEIIERSDDPRLVLYQVPGS